MKTETQVTIHFLHSGESEVVKCLYNTFGEIALIGDTDAVITMSPADACRLAKALRSAAEDALADLREAIEVA